ncbi:larval cuticle protein 2-like [Bactrocera neohumeralis]|uniref:larval cuticle protein 2-like n=1 Tax=Bactrocera tryoni TaxID=59916 RepID=UPI001A976578|nr:larval cuticle protein 2-like [Bactrocera tryoni]XP_050326257.1 larval cuticle protein 2-like [Bactrocera neohumeralis]
MFKYVLLVAFVAYASAAAVSSSDDAHAEVSVLKSDVRVDGFDTALETSNSIHVVQHGDEKGNINGEYGWVSPEGEHVSVNYVADESGYHPQSELLPVAPPVPEAIVKALAYIAAHPSKESTN